MSKNQSDSIVTMREACRRLGVQRQTIRNWIAKGRFPAPKKDGEYAQSRLFFDADVFAAAVRSLGVRS